MTSPCEPRGGSSVLETRKLAPTHGWSSCDLWSSHHSHEYAYSCKRSDILIINLMKRSPSASLARLCTRFGPCEQMPQYHPSSFFHLLSILLFILFAPRTRCTCAVSPCATSRGVCRAVGQDCRTKGRSQRPAPTRPVVRLARVRRAASTGCWYRAVYSARPRHRNSSASSSIWDGGGWTMQRTQ
jgi:hypothetical protein